MTHQNSNNALQHVKEPEVSPGKVPLQEQQKNKLKYWLSLLSGPACLLLTLTISAPEGMPQQAWYMVGVALMMAIWWIFEVVPIPVTSLLPIILLPILGITSIKDVTAPYAHPII